MAEHLILLISHTFLNGLTTCLLNTVPFSILLPFRSIPMHHSHRDSISMALIKQGCFGLTCAQNPNMRVIGRDTFAFTSSNVDE